LTFSERHIRDRSLWWDTLPGTIAPRPALQGDTDCDVAIVGAGMTGLWTAYCLLDADPSLPAATLRVGPRAAWMLEYFPMRVLTELPDGYCEASMTYAAEDWMARQLLGFGADVEVLAPASLVGRVRRAATEALAAYAAAESRADS
jgi:hypothetical protein